VLKFFETSTRNLLTISVMLVGQEPNVASKSKVTQLMSKDLPNVPGKEAVMITVDYPPGSSDPMHRHNENAIVYVLEGITKGTAFARCWIRSLIIEARPFYRFAS
jgi:gentisate 1,2-dioxygenase